MARGWISNLSLIVRLARSSLTGLVRTTSSFNIIKDGILTGILVCYNRVGYSQDWYHHGDVYLEVGVESSRSRAVPHVLPLNTFSISMYKYIISGACTNQ